MVPERSAAIDLLTQASIEPSVVGGGAMKTINTSSQTHYPRLNQSSPQQSDVIVESLKDYHFNVSNEGVVCDELIYMLSGGVHFYLYSPEGIIHLDVVASQRQGWLIMFKGSVPHGGFFY